MVLKRMRVQVIKYETCHPQQGKRKKKNERVILITDGKLILKPADWKGVKLVQMEFPHTSHLHFITLRNHPIIIKLPIYFAKVSFTSISLILILHLVA